MKHKYGEWEFHATSFARATSIELRISCLQFKLPLFDSFALL
jgi:hypothetical protein